MMCCKVELYWNYGNIALTESPFVGIFSFILIDEPAGQPVIIKSHWVGSFVKFLYPIGLGLSTNFDAFYFSSESFGKLTFKTTLEGILFSKALR